MSDQHIEAAIAGAQEAGQQYSVRMRMSEGYAQLVIPAGVRAWLDSVGLTAERAELAHQYEIYPDAREWFREWAEAIRAVQS